MLLIYILINETEKGKEKQCNLTSRWPEVAQKEMDCKGSRDREGKTLGKHRI